MSLGSGRQLWAWHMAHGTGVNQNCWQSKWSRCVFLSWFFFWFSFTFVLLYLSAFSRFPPILFILNWSCHLALCLTAVFHFRSFIFSCSFFLCVFLFLSSVSTYHSLPFSMRFFFVSCGFCGLFVCFMRQPRKAISRWKIVGGQSVRGVFFFLCRVESTKC